MCSLRIVPGQLFRLGISSLVFSSVTGQRNHLRRPTTSDSITVAAFTQQFAVSIRVATVETISREARATRAATPSLFFTAWSLAEKYEGAESSRAHWHKEFPVLT